MKEVSPCGTLGDYLGNVAKRKNYALRFTASCFSNHHMARRSFLVVRGALSKRQTPRLDSSTVNVA